MSQPSIPTLVAAVRRAAADVHKRKDLREREREQEARYLIEAAERLSEYDRWLKIQVDAQ